MSNIYRIAHTELEKFVRYHGTDKVILFYKANCIFCGAETECLGRLSEIYSSGIEYAICDVTDARQFCIDKAISRVPTLDFYRNGELLRRLESMQPYDVLEKEIQALAELSEKKLTQVIGGIESHNKEFVIKTKTVETTARFGTKNHAAEPPVQEPEPGVYGEAAFSCVE